MSEPSPQHPSSSPALGSDLFMALISAGLFLYVGFGISWLQFEDRPVYNASVIGFTWSARIVGIGLLVALGLRWLRVPGAATLDLVLAILAALACLVTGLIWLAYGYANGILLLVFGAFNASAARTTWTQWNALRRAGTGADDFSQ